MATTGLLANAQIAPIEVFEAPVTTGQSTGYNANTIDATPQVEANQYDASLTGAALYDHADVDLNQKNAAGINGYVQNNMNNLLDENGQYMQLNRQQAMEQANSRGLLNSSMAAGWGQRAAIESALPIAAQDANTFMQGAFSNQRYNNDARATNAAAQNQINLANQSSQNQAGSFNATAQNQANQFNAQQQQQTNLANQQSENQASQFAAQSANEFAARNMDSINRAASDFASASNQAAMQDVENQMRLLLAGAEEQLSNYSTDIQRKTALDNIASNLVQSGVNAGVFATVEGGANWLAMIGDLYPDMGLSVSDSLATTASANVA